jgi:hypothetical protein
MALLAVSSEEALWTVRVELHFYQQPHTFAGNGCQ